MGNLIRLLRNQFNKLNQLPWIRFCQAEGLVKGLSVGTISAGQGGGQEDEAFKQKQRGADKTQRAKVQATGKGPLPWVELRNLAKSKLFLLFEMMVASSIPI